MKHFYKKIKVLGLAVLLSFSSCMKDLDQDPTIDPDSINQSSVDQNPASAISVLAKLYASLALTGQKGPDGSPDVSGIDEGFSSFSRLLFYLQELPTDNAVVAWSDAGVPDFTNLSWNAANGIIEGMYYRLAQTISYANSFIENNQNKTDEEFRVYVAEARFIRAYAYYYLMDLFGDTPIVTQVKSELTSSDQSTRKQVFEFIEAELKDIENTLKAPKSNDYGRVDRAAAWALLSRLYLNANVYTGTERYSDCITYSEKVINSGYTLHTNYAHLFLADNDRNGAQNENIFTLNIDGVHSQTWGASTFLIHAAIGGTMKVEDFGLKGGAWAGLRTTKNLVDKFGGSGTAPTSWTDARAMFHTNEQTYEIEDVTKFKQGYAVTKFKNLTSTGEAGKDPSGQFVDTDVALIRLAEVYLNYAEAVVRGGGGSTSQALQYVNALRTRAGATSLTSLTAENVLDERSRELYWEGFRRTDLIRFGYFTSSSYLWPFKGGVKDGTGTSEYRNLYPIPTNIILASQGVIKQNQGY
ncbi:MAG: RagB/SusD family nutrient uptake outer membrane protein [Capnocytophaga sp.]|nr:RagB/SusD family nutrient uptake outer membrane protein [Capnocytophaga sp.]